MSNNNSIYFGNTEVVPQENTFDNSQTLEESIDSIDEPRARIKSPYSLEDNEKLLEKRKDLGISIMIDIIEIAPKYALQMAYFVLESIISEDQTAINDFLSFISNYVENESFGTKQKLKSKAEIKAINNILNGLKESLDEFKKLPVPRFDRFFQCQSLLKTLIDTLSTSCGDNLYLIKIALDHLRVKKGHLVGIEIKNISLIAYFSLLRKLMVNISLDDLAKIANVKLGDKIKGKMKNSFSFTETMNIENKTEISEFSEPEISKLKNIDNFNLHIVSMFDIFTECARTMSIKHVKVIMVSAFSVLFAYDETDYVKSLDVFEKFVRFEIDLNSQTGVNRIEKRQIDFEYLIQQYKKMKDLGFFGQLSALEKKQFLLNQRLKCPQLKTESIFLEGLDKHFEAISQHYPFRTIKIYGERMKEIKFMFVYEILPKLILNLPKSLEKETFKSTLKKFYLVGTIFREVLKLFAKINGFNCSMVEKELEKNDSKESSEDLRDDLTNYTNSSE